MMETDLVGISVGLLALFYLVVDRGEAGFILLLAQFLWKDIISMGFTQRLYPIHRVPFACSFSFPVWNQVLAGRE